MRLIAIKAILPARTCNTCGTDRGVPAQAIAAFERSFTRPTPQARRAADEALALWLAREKCGRHKPSSVRAGTVRRDVGGLGGLVCAEHAEAEARQ